MALCLLCKPRPTTRTPPTHTPVHNICLVKTHALCLAGCLAVRALRKLIVHERCGIRCNSWVARVHSFTRTLEQEVYSLAIAPASSHLKPVLVE